MNWNQIKFKLKLQIELNYLCPGLSKKFFIASSRVEMMCKDLLLVLIHLHQGS